MNFFRQLIDFLTFPFRMLLRAPLAVISAPRRLMGMSLPARVAVLVAIFLVICTITAYIVFWANNKRGDYVLWFAPGRIAVIVILLIVIPLVIHRALKLWLEGVVSDFPDIDFAWREGLAALEKNGLDLSMIPVFVVIGARCDVHARGIVDASRVSLRVRDVPQGPAALHWFADPHGVYMVCTETCQLSRLAKLAAGMEGDAASAAKAPRAARHGQEMLRGTIVPGSMDHLRDSTSSMSPGLAAPRGEPDFGGPNIRGTMIAGGGDSMPASVSAKAALGAALSPPDAAEQTARLEYVCRLLRRARQPLCPLNGILTLLPFDLVQRGPREGIEVQRAVKQDLATIRRMCKVRCPVTALVVGMETESGFRELIRRVGSQRAQLNRFGKGYNLWNVPTAEQLVAVAAHACGAFEDWVYTLFRERDGFNKPGNTKLYAMLCKIRSDLHKRLTNLLVAGYANDAETGTTDPEPLLFSGCYFAATGETEDRQAFVKSVFEKLLDEENELQWTADALVEDRRYQQLARLVMTLDVLLALSLIGMLVYRFVL